ncbi:MAG: hypothetical protein WCF67_03835 [Chitinophagaceae bacterium]
MEPKSIISGELKQISPTVAEIGFNLPYQVPQRYFEGLAEAILKRIKAESLSAGEELQTLSPLLAGLNKKSPYHVPDGYFSELSENVVGGMKAVDFVNNELQEISPVLDALKDKNVYQVPQGYFENLAGNILNRVKEAEPAKVIRMNPARRLMRYAAAAVITGAIAIGGWLYFNNDKPVTDPDTKLAAVDKISDDSKVSDEEMASYLENETFIATNTASVENTGKDDELNASDVKEMLSDVSEDELKDYLITL